MISATARETVSIVAREPDASRSLLSSVDSISIPTDFGGFVPLSQVAKVVPVLEQGVEWRRDRLPTISVRATLPGWRSVERCRHQIVRRHKGPA